MGGTGITGDLTGALTGGLMPPIGGAGITGGLIIGGSDRTGGRTGDRMIGGTGVITMGGAIGGTGNTGGLLIGGNRYGAH